MTTLKKVSKRTALSVARATTEGLKSYSELVLSITADNGSEFARHEKISQE
jgi:IS30 family transposase